ncbi:BZ3500_MvSof-1268-A1-R1_Chr12-2g03728 [Microbotryum saponariae]|uniref:BZ3500_MvSof-1268-A1-R1_Chr12-2g03728 protein n=1 Tax=Microbotryum saponariae TaxID=289078 RepID=A0A2X0LE09_9BASI|nr:BZ3500_MvSof-1268-A1-R1_Chr12-2g03728 [Microbotryum saponariae]SDA05316.1 BZ3501_MvSof-1269-A2-R1_Chr12-1g03300 [Microbotryum saponariae]
MRTSPKLVLRPRLIPMLAPTTICMVMKEVTHKALTTTTSQMPSSSTGLGDASD